MQGYRVDRYSSGTWIAHRDDGHDCLDDDFEMKHATGDHPVAALRALLKKEEVKS